MGVNNLAKKTTKKGPLAHNKRAHFDVEIEKTYEAGISLTGDEIKSIRAGRLQLSGSYVKFLGNRPVLIGLHLSLANDPARTRNLLLHATEVLAIREAVQAEGKTAVPLDVYLKRGWAKVSIGLGKGRKQYNKRNLLKRRDIARETERTLRAR